MTGRQRCPLCGALTGHLAGHLGLHEPRDARDTAPTDDWAPEDDPWHGESSFDAPTPDEWR